MAGLSDEFFVVIRDDSRSWLRASGAFATYDEAKNAAGYEIESMDADVYFVIERRWRKAQPDDDE